MTNVHLAEEEKNKLNFSFNIKASLPIWTFKSNEIKQITNVQVTLPFQRPNKGNMTQTSFNL